MSGIKCSSSYLSRSYVPKLSRHEVKFHHFIPMWVSRFWLAATNGGQALDGINGRKERHAAEEPPAEEFNKYPGRLRPYS